MMNPLLNSISNGNPQLIREIKGRLNPRNICLVTGMSMVTQFLIWASLSEQPGDFASHWSSPYCNLKELYNQYHSEITQLSKQLHSTSVQPPNSAALQQRLDELNGLMIYKDCPAEAVNWVLWWKDYWTEVFMALSVIGFFSLIVAGTYMLISDLATEERRGTLNFIRLSPQSHQGIFLGKLLGVPILLYLGIALMIPFHLFAGLSAEVPLSEILLFDGLVISSSIFFSSFALLFGMVTSWLGSFQAWLGSGAVFIGLMVMNAKPIETNGFDWLNIFSPSILLRYLVNRTGDSYSYFPFGHHDVQNLEWFGFPIGAVGIFLAIFALVHYGVWTAWIWQGLKRCFHTPTATVLSKADSYWITACFSLFNLGFASQNFEFINQSKDYYVRDEYYAIALGFNLVLFSLLIAALSPHRQDLQDWARYRQEHQRVWQQRIRDLVLGDKSPAVLAIVLNLAIMAALFTLTMLVYAQPEDYLAMIGGLVLNISLIFLGVSLVQLTLMMKHRKRAVWAVGIVSAVVILPWLCWG
ncbi:MAG: hypothetical protein HC835_17270 [Oscillatoriales cyanobacterium RM2_1_1]|nr:hypothetical protein [Oscillatoriales cyanobacterium RM2_1_1]